MLTVKIVDLKDEKIEMKIPVRKVGMSKMNLMELTEEDIWVIGLCRRYGEIFSIQELEHLEKMIETGEIERLTKKEGLLIRREIARLETHLAGVRTMSRVPDMVFIVDVSREYAAVHEANLLNIPIVALVDTNCDPSNIDYVIPSNDDAIRAIKLLVAKIADAVLEGKALRKDVEEEQLAPEEGVAVPGAEELELSDEELLGDPVFCPFNILWALIVCFDPFGKFRQFSYVVVADLLLLLAIYRDIQPAVRVAIVVRRACQFAFLMTYFAGNNAVGLLIYNIHIRGNFP
jgi:hypothetical protein